MNVVVSPYHLTTREPVALATLLLARRVVTLMPAPFRTLRPDDLRRAATTLPRYRKLVESWRWTEPLWQSGALVSSLGERDAVEDVRRVHTDLASGAYSELSPLMREGLFDDERRYLDAVAGDVLKGGPDPGICVPLSAGLDRFAVRHRLLVARSAPSSVAQLAEEAIGKRIFAFSIPVLTQSGGELLADVREDSAEILGPLRAAVSGMSSLVRADDPAIDADAIGMQARAITDSAREVTQELGELLESAVASSDRDDVRAITGTATVMGIVLPVDAVLQSSSRAARAMIGQELGVAFRDPPAEESRLPVLADPLAGGTFIALVIKIVGARTSSRWK